MPSRSQTAAPARRWVVCFAPGDYHAFTPSCATHIMHEMHRRGYGVLWVNPAPIGMPAPTRRGGWNRIRRRLKSYLRPLRRVRSGFYTISPLALPAGLGGGRVNEHLLRLQLRAVAGVLRIAAPITWVENASLAGAARMLPGPSIYQLSDKYELSRYASAATRRRLAANSQELVSSADVVTCTARTLWRELQAARPDVLYLPHAVDLELFQPAPEGPLPPDLRDLPRPLIGYFGTLSSSNDQSVIQAMARRHPEWTIVLIGRVTGGDWSETRRLPNVHFLGFKPLAEIPRYGASFDVAFMAWHLDEWMHYVNPLKAREYLALGLPVVACPIPEIVESYAGQIHVAAQPEAFVEGVERALQERSPEHSARQRAAAARCTWRLYVDRILAELDRATGSAVHVPHVLDEL